MKETIDDYVLVKVTTCDDDSEPITEKLDFSHKEFEEYVNHLHDMFEHGFIFLNISQVTENYYEIQIYY